MIVGRDCGKIVGRNWLMVGSVGRMYVMQERRGVGNGWEGSKRNVESKILAL